MSKMANRARMTVSSTGTGDIALGAAVVGFQAFAAAGIANGDTISYAIEDGANWEVGTGVYSSTGPTLSRNTVVASSSSGAPISITTGAQVFVTALASDLQAGMSATNLVERDSTGAIRLNDGTAAAPSLSRNNDDCGIFFPAADQVGISTNGTQRAVVSSSGLTLSSPLTVASGGTGVTTSTGTGSVVLSNSPTLVTPDLGTPSSGNLANCTFPTLNQNTTGTAAGLSATLNVASGGTGLTSLTAGRIPFGSGTSAFGSSSNLFWDGSRLLLGSTTAQAGGAGLIPNLQLHGTTNGTSTYGVFGWGSAVTPFNQYNKSNSTTIGTYSIVSNGAFLGEIGFAGDDGTAFVRAASIRAIVASAPATGSMPGALVFNTTPSGSTTPTERLRITSSGNVGIGCIPTVPLDMVANSNSNAFRIRGRSSDNVSTVDFLSNSATGASYLYIQAAPSYAAFGTQNVERLRIDSSGNVGINATSSSNIQFRVGGLAPSATNSFTTYFDQLIPATATSSYTAFLSVPSTAASAFTCPFVTHYKASQGALGSGSAITIQYGFHATASMTGATNNFGFYSEIPSGTGRWNFYANGTADNYFAGNVLGASAISAGNTTNTGTSGVVRLTATGGVGYIQSGLAISANSAAPLVFGSVFAGAEWMRIDSSGNVGIGATPSAGNTLRLGKTVTGAATSSIVLQVGTVQSDVTEAHGFRNRLSTAVASFTVGNYHHFRADVSSIGAGSTVTNQMGFYVDSTMTGATNNYGVYSGLASSTGVWNFYAAGTASNYFGGVVEMKNVSAAPTSIAAGNGVLYVESGALKYRGSSGTVTTIAAA